MRLSGYRETAMSNVDVKQLARELYEANATGQLISIPPSARDIGFDLTAAYAVEAELVRLRQAAGHATVGRKVGFASKALWRKLKLETLVWANMYDDTVHHADSHSASLSLTGMVLPKIEPEIVLKLREPLVTTGGEDAVTVLKSVEWIAMGFEIINYIFPDGQFQPIDFVAAFGFHAALVISEPRPVTPDNIPSLAEQLAQFNAQLFKDGQFMEEGRAKNALGSPALCLGELARAIAQRSDAVPLAAGELISSGTLTTPLPVTAGEEWAVQVDGLDVSGLTLRFVG
jgi:2-oxo-3-hexenedioate decarboxylase